jgi:hypothetical protein
MQPNRHKDLPPAIVMLLHNKGCVNWDKVITDSKLSQFKLNCVLRRLATNNEYNMVADTMCIKGSIAIKEEIKDITVFECARRRQDA